MMANILSWTQKILKKSFKKELTIDFLYARMKNEKGKSYVSYCFNQQQ